MGWLWVWVAIAGAAGGCAHSGARNKGAGLIPPPVPAFLSGPMGVLLTNLPGFAAHVRLDSEHPSSTTEPFSGELLGRGPKLLFAPDFSSAATKRFRACGFSFVWDVSEQRGFLFSEALQGYAPISSQVQATNVVAGPARLASDKVDGHACEQVELTVDSRGGAPAVFRVWRATDLQGFPVRILCVGQVRPLTLYCSSIRLEAPAAKLFQPPGDFTRYESSEAMMAEMAIREENLHRKPKEKPLGEEPMPSMHPGAR
jgi:hypothetical protein